MTYCVGLLLDQGMVMLADTRTNAGFDNISCFRKLNVFRKRGERLIATMSAGNLALTQVVINRLTDGVPNPKTGEIETIYTVPTMSRAVDLVSEIVRQVYHTFNPVMGAQQVAFGMSIMLGGQILGQSVRLFHVYAAGNYIEATSDTPFLQIGEHKYGKPILDRNVTIATGLTDAVKLALVSMDSTLRSNLSVGMPLDLLVYQVNNPDDVLQYRIEEDDSYFETARGYWQKALADAATSIPIPPWM